MKTNNTPSTMNAKETKANHIRESISRLRYELQQYHDNASKGGSERRRNMVLLRWDIRRLENQLKAIKRNEAVVTLNAHNLNRGNKFRYMMLNRMQCDCEYYLGFGDRNANHSLWALNEADHIAIMRALWLSLPVSPEWLTLEQIDKYAGKMNVAI